MTGEQEDSDEEREGNHYTTHVLFPPTFKPWLCELVPMDMGPHVHVDWSIPSDS